MYRTGEDSQFGEAGACAFHSFAKINSRDKRIQRFFHLILSNKHKRLTNRDDNYYRTKAILGRPLIKFTAGQRFRGQMTVNALIFILGFLIVLNNHHRYHLFFKKHGTCRTWGQVSIPLVQCMFPILS